MVTPNVCPVNYVVDIDEIPGFPDESCLQEGIDANGLDVTIFCDSTLNPVDKCQTVTITATSGTAVVPTSYKVCYKNPCIDPNFFSITAPTSLPDKTYAIYGG